MNTENPLKNAKNIVVIGASNNRNKFGYKIVQELKKKFKVLPVNPNHNKIQEINCFHSILEIPRETQIDIVSIVTPPPTTQKILNKISKRGVSLVWFQPGSFDDKIIEQAKNLQLNFIYDKCILIENSKI